MKKYARVRKYRTKGSTKKKVLVKEAYKKDRFIRYKRKGGFFKRLSKLECVLIFIVILGLGYSTYEYILTKYPEVYVELIKYIHHYGIF
jgi:hypothetical protein